MSEECPAGGEHCAHWFDGEACCFCGLDGPCDEDPWEDPDWDKNPWLWVDEPPSVVTVEIRDGLL